MEIPVELSVVRPCLNEEETVGVCVRKAVETLQMASIQGEVIVADNGSADGSVEAARAEGARVVNVKARGYGNALMGGIAVSHGEYALMADADDSYDFAHIPRFLLGARGCVEGNPPPFSYNAHLDITAGLPSNICRAAHTCPLIP